MKKILIILLLFLFVGLIWSESSTTTISDNKQYTIIKKLEGDWGTEVWYKTLINTKSPIKANLVNYNNKRRHYLSHINFANQPDKNNYYLIKLNLSFNEETEFNFNRIKTVKKNQEEEYILETVDYLTEFPSEKIIKEISSKKKAVVKFLDDNRILFQYNLDMNYDNSKWDSDTFVKLKPTLTEFVNKTIIAGNYIDIEGKNYIFEPNGNLIWDNKIMKYKINHYVNQVKCDFFTTLNPTIRYAFEVNISSLVIYNTYFDKNDSIEKQKKPLLILNRK
jgi:hypothetical protein